MTMLLQSLAALAAVLALFAGLVWLLRRWQQRMPHASTGGEMRVAARCAIDARHSVVELEAGGRRWLVGVSPEGLTALGDYDPPTEATHAGTPASGRADAREKP